MTPTSCIDGKVLTETWLSDIYVAVVVLFLAKKTKLLLQKSPSQNSRTDWWTPLFYILGVLETDMLKELDLAKLNFLLLNELWEYCSYAWELIELALT